MGILALPVGSANFGSFKSISGIRETDNTPTVSRFLPFPFNPFKWLKAKSPLLPPVIDLLSLLGESASSTDSLFPLSPLFTFPWVIWAVSSDPRGFPLPLSIFYKPITTLRCTCWEFRSRYDPIMQRRLAVCIFWCWLSRHIVLDLFLILKIRILCLCCLLSGKTYAYCPALFSIHK